jgi:hypothetical protein
MKKIICILVCAVFWNCGGDSGLRITSESELSSNSSREKNRGNYPGFFEPTTKPSSNSSFFDGFFDRHSDAIKEITYDFDIEQTDGVGNVSNKRISTNAYVNYGGIASQVFALHDKYNVVNVHLSWDPEESYANRENLKFFLCNIDNINDIKPIDGIDYTPVDGLRCSIESNMCAIDLSDWSKGEKNITLEVNVDQHNENVKIGLCMQYAAYLPVVYDALEVRVYNTQTYNVTLAHVGKEDNGIKTKIENRIKETLNRAGVEIDFNQEITYRIPEDFEDVSYRIRQLPKDYLYVEVDSKGAESSCYREAGIGDDLFWLKSKVESDIGYGKNERRTAVILNKPSVKFWTLDGDYCPCIKNLEDWPRNDGFHTYIVGVLNNGKYNECQQKYPNSGEVYYGYNRTEGKMGWFNNFSQPIDGEISSYINPECHVLVDLDRMGSPNWKDDKAQRYYRTLIPSGALGVAMRAQFVGGRTGLMSFNPPDDEVVFVHELTHLCGLADVSNPQDNLMYESNKGGTKLGNIPLNVKESSDTEQQWDCLHDDKYADGCHDKSHRLLNF